MAVFKCKMCGGALEIIEGSTVAECEYCGTKQTVPTADNEKKLNLFARANRLRTACEFDKAASLYESIVAEFPEEAEAYWGLVLCEYGIEYVDDPATGKKIPTCHRSSFESVIKDSNVELAQEYADNAARRLYREEAKQIEELRKNILSVSENEKPYDIFICYKETDFDGKRTLDSVLAQDIYDALTNKNYRVFFSRISLEDKLGLEYEPYIFAALNSAKIMLVIGTDYDHLNAVWVKNEWSRFLKLMAKDKQKHLIPCYKGIDAYDMPEEFARLQAQDLDKMGAVQDILRGVDKLLQKDAETVAATAPVQQATSNPSVESYLKRVFIFLDDGDFKSADEYCEKVLDIDPENAQAYLGKLMAELHVCKQEQLKNLSDNFDSSINYTKIKRYGDESLISTIDGYVVHIAERIEQERIESEQKILKILNLSKKTQKLIDAGDDYTICLKSDGTVVAVGGDYIYGQHDVHYWSNIVGVATSGNHTVGLKADGTVVAAGDNYHNQCEVSEWRDIIAISASEHFTIGLRSNGTVLSTGSNVYNQCDASTWTDIVAVAAGGWHTVGLKADGTVVAVGYNNKGQCNVKDWTDIVAVAAGNYHTVGLKSNGTVVATGYNYYDQCNVSNWTDIIAITAGNVQTVGIRNDYTVVAAGYNYYDQCNVNNWTDIVAITTGYKHTVGVKSNGTVVAVGDNTSDQCNVNGLKLFSDIALLEQERAEKMESAHVRVTNALRKRQEFRNAGLCQHCGGTFKGFLTKKCAGCGKEKDY